MLCKSGNNQIPRHIAEEFVRAVPARYLPYAFDPVVPEIPTTLLKYNELRDIAIEEFIQNPIAFLKNAYVNMGKLISIEKLKSQKRTETIKIKIKEMWQGIGKPIEDDTYYLYYHVNPLDENSYAVLRVLLQIISPAIYCEDEEFNYAEMKEVFGGIISLAGFVTGANLSGPARSHTSSTIEYEVPIYCGGLIVSERLAEVLCRELSALYDDSNEACRP